MPGDLSGKTITYATITYDLGGGEITLGDVGEVYALTQSWLEGTGIAHPADQNNGCSWNTYDGTNAWVSSGGDVEGTDTNEPGLESITRAKYAWNDAANLLYIGIESNEPNLILEVGGLMGDCYDDNNEPYDEDEDSPEGGSGRATQIEFKNWSGGTAGTVTNQAGAITTGVINAYTINSGVMTIEIETPIYSDWYNVGTVMDLVNRSDIYEYANVIDSISDSDRGDSQIADGTYVSAYSTPTTQVGSLIRLIQTSSPQSTDDIPHIFIPTGTFPDYDKNGIVDFKDFAHFAIDWLDDSVP